MPVGAATGTAVLLVAVMSLTSGCSVGQSPRLIDESDVVTEYQFHVGRDVTLPVPYEELETGGSGALAVEPPAGWDIRVVWPATPCALAPTVRVTGIDGQVTAIHVEYGPHEAGNCPDELLIFGVDLRTSRPPAPDLVVSGE